MAIKVVRRASRSSNLTIWGVVPAALFGAVLRRQLGGLLEKAAIALAFCFLCKQREAAKVGPANSAAEDICCCVFFWRGWDVLNVHVVFCCQVGGFPLIHSACNGIQHCASLQSRCVQAQAHFILTSRAVRGPETRSMHAQLPSLSLEPADMTTHRLLEEARW